MRRTRLTPFFLLACLLLAFPGAHAALIKGDFRNAGDGLLIFDTDTGLEWLSPLLTRGDGYNGSVVQNLIAGDGFRYATASEASSMIRDNFDDPINTNPGDLAGFQSAQAFFDVFGINQAFNCSAVGPCPRTQAFTSTQITPGRRLAYGMIQFGSTGYMLDGLNQFETFNGQQIGSWLVRGGSAPVPAPAAILLLPLLLLGARRRSPR